MLPIKDQISILARLSIADHDIAKEEKDMIHSIASRNGLSEIETNEIIHHPNEIPALRELPSDEKFEYLYNVIKLMKIDGKIHRNEIRFCEKIAIRLGYKPGVIADLSAYIYQDLDINANSDYLRSIADKQLMRKP